MKESRIYYVRWTLPPYRAMTIPPFGIFIKKRYRKNDKILNHEMIHWKQYQRMGLLKFYYQYFREFLVIGYDKMPMEMEARYEENEYKKNNYSKTYHSVDKLSKNT